MSHDTADPNTSRYAPRYPIAEKNLVTVEHPGYVQNVENAIASLGGSLGLAKILNGKSPGTSVGLYFHPEDSFRKPVMSSQATTQNIVLKVTVPKRTGRKRKRGSSEPFLAPERASPAKLDESDKLLRSLIDNPDRYQIEAIGSSNKTHRFRKLPDFQYALTASPLVKSIRESILPFEYDKLKNFSFDTTTKGPQPNMEMIPPPSFTQLDIPFNYQYRQNPAVRLTFDEEGRPTSINTSMPRRTIILLVDYDVDEVPSAPNPDLTPEGDLDPRVQTLLKKIRNLQQSRPILTRRVVRNLQPEALEKDIQTVFQYVGYTFRSGPWRDAVVKFGLDPRADPSCRIYQTRTFQINAKTAAADAAPDDASELATPNPTTAPTDTRYQRPMRSERDPADHTSHVFDGRRLVADGRIWQCCDVTDPQLQQLLEHSAVRRTCHIRNDGWFPNGTWAMFHVVMRDKINLIAAGHVPSDTDYARLLAEMPGEIHEGNIARTVFSSRSDATPKEVALASEIRGLAKESNNMIGLKMGSGAGKASTRPRVASLGIERAAGREGVRNLDPGLQDGSLVDGELQQDAMDVDNDDEAV